MVEHCERSHIKQYTCSTLTEILYKKAQGRECSYRSRLASLRLCFVPCRFLGPSQRWASRAGIKHKELRLVWRPKWPQRGVWCGRGLQGVFVGWCSPRGGGLASSLRRGGGWIRERGLGSAWAACLRGARGRRLTPEGKTCVRGNSANKTQHVNISNNTRIYHATCLGLSASVSQNYQIEMQYIDTYLPHHFSKLLGLESSLQEHKIESVKYY